MPNRSNTLNSRDTLTRRYALRALTVAGTGLLLASCTHMKAARNMLSGGPDSLEPVDIATDDVAQSMGYVASVPTNSPLYGKQSCLNCSRYIANIQKPGWGRCIFFSTGLVDEKGWCRTWARQDPTD